MSKTQQTPSGDLPKLSRPALQALHAAGCYTLQQVSQYSEKGLLQLHGMGPKGVRILQQALKERGMSFATPPSNSSKGSSKRP